MAWGRRRASPGQPAPRLSVPDVYLPFRHQIKAEGRSNLQPNPEVQADVTQSNGKGAAFKGLSHIEVYNTKEEALEAIKKRSSGTNSPPPPSVGVQ